MKAASLALFVMGCSASAEASARVRFEGLHDVPEASLRSANDELHVLAALYDQGYVEAKVHSSRRVASDGAPEITFRVEEGRRFRLRSAQLHERDSQSARATLHRTKIGDWFCRSDVVRDLDDARVVYASLGHRDAKISPTMTLDESALAVDLDLVIDP